MSDEQERINKELRNTASRLLVYVGELLKPASANPSPYRMKLDQRMDDLRNAISEYDRLRSPYASTGPSEGLTTTEGVRPPPPPAPPAAPPTKRMKEHQSATKEAAQNG